ncbi:MAG TPA: tRNA uridine-5-carboxymethylaminomethyl(34) synthesis GTPase MnmE [Calditrichia bacterium]|nr:tRNA uridine-5-carboxymethylaminomethyl(34) synthesis GTPase MnmE [Calditrichota bacterium]HQV30938.1 tRNA uridine-5-carboxymethylaminomethyl(34) synthesis GTPase MnmE [Calditrichia bacterium]
MKHLPDSHTIVALSTPLGSGAIAIIRLSGPDALDLINPLLSKSLGEDNIRLATFAEICEGPGGKTIDQVVVTWFQGPRSYTGEDIVEISCHCNTLIIDAIISALVRQGARIAEPGEFTLRAFLKGKIDLSQAEAVADIINARTRQSLHQSMRHLEGRLSERLKEISGEVLNYLSLLEINLDFSEEGIEVMPMAELSRRITRTAGQLQELLNTYDYGRYLQEGIQMTILGKPNVGKSSLLNQLLQKERAIVSEIPGTTRDYIEANLDIEGLAVKAVDTAGIRKTEDRIEAIGVERTLQQLDSADIALAVFEGNRELDGDDRALLQIIRDHRELCQFVVVLNKTDIARNVETEKTLQPLGIPLVALSAKSGEGIGALKKCIKESLIGEQSLESEEIVVTSARHKKALAQTIEALLHADQSLHEGASDEILAVDIRLAMDHLGEITGETTSEDVLNHIFGNFCIGK